MFFHAIAPIGKGQQLVTEQPKKLVIKISVPDMCHQTRCTGYTSKEKCKEKKKKR